MNELYFNEKNMPISYSCFDANRECFRNSTFKNGIIIRDFESNTTRREICQLIVDWILSLNVGITCIIGLLFINESGNPLDNLSVIVLLRNNRELMWRIRTFYQQCNNNTLVNLNNNVVKICELKHANYTIKYVKKSLESESLLTMETVAFLNIANLNVLEIFELLENNMHPEEIKSVVVTKGRIFVTVNGYEGTLAIMRNLLIKFTTDFGLRNNDERIAVVKINESNSNNVIVVEFMTHE